MFHLLYITNNPNVAEIAEKNGVDRIWLDFEKNGKEGRQRGQDSVISNHSISDLYEVRKRIKKSQIVARVNPWFEGSIKEIDEVIRAGADIVMLPMWKSIEEVERFVAAVDGRARTLLLLETREAAEYAVDDVLARGIADEIHIGLRDLSLSYGIDFLFSIYSGDILERVASKIRKKGVPFGIGGVGKFGIGLCPGPERLLIESIRLGSSSVILARTFCNTDKINDLDRIDEAFRDGIRELRKWEKIASRMPMEIFDYNKAELIKEVEEN